MAADPGVDTDLAEPQSWNKYTYVRNNPLLLVDPDGRFLIIGSHRHQNMTRQAAIQANGVSQRDVVRGNRQMDTGRIFGHGERSDHLNTDGAPTGSAGDTRVQAGGTQLGTAIRQFAAGNVEAAGEALGASQHSFQDLVGHGGASVAQHYDSDGNGTNMDHSHSPGFSVREAAAIALTSQLNDIFNQATAAIATGADVDETVAAAQTQAATAAQASYSSTSTTLRQQGQSPAGY